MNPLKLIPALLLLATPTAFSQQGEYNFLLEIDGISSSNYLSVEGVSIEIEVVEYQEGADPVLRKRPGRIKYGDITLKRGYTSTTELWDWVQATRLESPNFKKGMSLVLLDAASNTEVSRYDFFECWPTKWKVSALDGTASNLVTEEITVVTELIDYVRSGP